MQSNVNEKCTTATEWLARPETWKRLAEKCARAGHFVFAVDCFQQALECNARAKADGGLWFSLAKALFRSGNAEDAMVAVKHASDVDEGRSIAIEEAVKNWGERERLERGGGGDIGVEEILGMVERSLKRKKAVAARTAAAAAAASPPSSPATPTILPSSFFLTSDPSDPLNADLSSPVRRRSKVEEGMVNEEKVNDDNPETEKEEEDSSIRPASSSNRSSNEHLFSPSAEGTLLALPDEAHEAHEAHEDLSVFTSTNPLDLLPSASSPSLKRSSSSRTRTVIGEQLNKTLQGRLHIREDLLSRETVRHFSADSLPASSDDDREQPLLPLWKQKHRETDLKNAASQNQWKERLNTAKAEARQKKAERERTFMPSFSSMPQAFRAQSVMRYKKLGYPSGKAETYRKHWQRKIDGLLGGMVDFVELRQCLNSVRLHFPSVTNDSALVALAEAHGSVEEACAKLSEAGFVREAELVAGVIDLRQYVRKSGGRFGEEEGRQEEGLGLEGGEREKGEGKGGRRGGGTRGKMRDRSRPTASPGSRRRSYVLGSESIGSFADFESSLDIDSMSLTDSSLFSLPTSSAFPGHCGGGSRPGSRFAFPPVPAASSRVGTPAGVRRTPAAQALYMRALSDPAAKSSKVNDVDLLVERFSSERRETPAVTIKMGSVIRASDWNIEEKNRICWNRKRSRLLKMENLREQMMTGEDFRSIGGAGGGGGGGGGGGTGFFSPVRVKPM